MYSCLEPRNQLTTLQNHVELRTICPDFLQNLRQDETHRFQFWTVP